MQEEITLGALFTHDHRVLTESQYCIYVNYDSDSDEEEVNEREVKSRLLDNIIIVVEMYLICNMKGRMQSP